MHKANGAKQDGGAQQGFALWFTGLPASGKTTLAHALAQGLAVRGVHTQLLDSDELRKILTPHPNYSAEERDWFYATIVYLAQLLTANGVNVLLAATASRRAYREQARVAIPRLVEVYVRCSLERAMARDQKGIYAAAQQGAASTVPGLQVPYETPQQPDLSVDTETEASAQSVARILTYLQEQKFID
ncbi:MAG: adenylyl-sulfate kinase [Caldilineaceae bacterium]